MTIDPRPLIEGQPVMAILRNMSPDRAVELAEKAWDLGIELVEVPIQSLDAVPSLQAVIAAGARRGKSVGSGTVVSPGQVQASIDLGAAFTVAPGTDERIIEMCAEAGLPHLPGVSTPSDIQTALRLGIRTVKAFPATVLGTGWFAAMRGPFPEVSFVATGGIDSTNAKEYLQAGAVTVALGTALADGEQLDAVARLVASSEHA